MKTSDLIKRLRIVGGVGDEAADLIEAQQKQIEELEAVSVKSTAKALKVIMDENEIVQRLAEAQAQIKVLRGYLFAAYGMATESPENQPFDWAVFCELLHKALAQPTDDSALQAAIAAEREACAVVAWLHYMDTCKKHGHGSDVEKIRDFCAAAAIRAMEDK